MRANPTSAYSRTIVRLVIFAVAVPSLLLTGMGILAIRNEEAAARKRLTETYMPLEMAIAKRFNADMDAMRAASAEALAGLVARAAGERPVSPALAEFVESHPYAVNYFVVDRDGTLLFPRDRASTEPPSPAELPHLERLLVSFGRAMGAVGREAGRQGPLRDPEGYVEAARDLGLALSDPMLPHPPPDSERLAREVASRLLTLDGRDAGLARVPLESIAARSALLAVAPRFQRPPDGEGLMSSQEIEGWRRLVFVRSVGDRLAGFELTPGWFSERLTRELHELGGSKDLMVEIMGLHGGRVVTSLGNEWNDKLEKRIITYAVLKKTELAWQIGIMGTGDGAFSSLVHSRVPLYVWSLALIVSVLVVGIVLTIRAVVREARISRLKTDFVSSVSHDLRTPLTSIRMFTETLLMGRVRTREEERECLEVVAQETERLSRLTERILDFARMEAGRKPYTFTPTEVPPIVEHALAATRPLVTESGCEVAVDVEPSLPVVEVDRDAIIEALINLVTNAVKYSPEEKRIEVSARAEGEGVAISVADHGIGIPRGEQGRIFEMFYRVDNQRTSEVGGSGIGLSLVKHIVDAHHGRITVDSAPGRGSMFTLHLPPSPAAVAEAVDGEHPRRRRRSLHRQGADPKPAV